MTTVHGTARSGNCWKAAQILRLTGRPFRWVEVDANGGETRTPAFLAHFAEGTPWLPPPGLARTRVFEWLFWEQYSHEPHVAVARNIRSRPGAAEAEADRLERCRVGGERALDVMEGRLSRHEWLTDAGPTIADLALFAYTHVADEGGFDLARWPAVLAWTARVRALPGIVPLR